MKEYLAFAYDSSINDTQVFFVEAEDPQQVREAVKYNYKLQGWPMSDLLAISVVRISRNRTREYKDTSILLLGKASHLLARQEQPEMLDSDPRYSAVIDYLNATATDLIYLGARSLDEHIVQFSTVRVGNGAPFTFTLPATIVQQLACSLETA